MSLTNEQLEKKVSKYYTRWQKTTDKLKDSESVLAQTQQALTERDQEASMLRQEVSMLRKENERLAGLLHDLKKHFLAAPSPRNKSASVLSGKFVTIPFSDSEDEDEIRGDGSEKHSPCLEESSDEESDDEHIIRAHSQKSKPPAFTFGTTPSTSASPKPSSTKGGKGSSQTRPGDVFQHNPGGATYRKININMSGFTPSRPGRKPVSDNEDDEVSDFEDEDEEEIPVCRFYNTPKGCSHGKKCKFRHVKQHHQSNSHPHPQRQQKHQQHQQQKHHQQKHHHHQHHQNQHTTGGDRRPSRRSGQASGGKFKGHTHSGQYHEKKSGRGSTRSRKGHTKKSGRGSDAREYQKSSSGRDKKKSGHGKRRSHHQSRC